MDIVYKKIVDTFNANKAVFTDKGLPAIRQIDINYGQLDDPENFEIFLPGIYVGWEIDNESNPTILYLDFHLGQDPGASTTNNSENLSKGLEYLGVLNTAKYILNKLRATNTTPFTYIGERPARTPYFNYHIIRYKCYIDVVDDSLTEGKTEDIELTDYTKNFKTPEKTETPLPLEIETMK